MPTKKQIRNFYSVATNNQLREHAQQRDKTGLYLFAREELQKRLLSGKARKKRKSQPFYGFQFTNRGFQF